MLRNFSEKEAVRNFLGNLHVHPNGKSLRNLSEKEVMRIFLGNLLYFLEKMMTKSF